MAFWQKYSLILRDIRYCTVRSVHFVHTNGVHTSKTLFNSIIKSTSSNILNFMKSLVPVNPSFGKNTLMDCSRIKIYKHRTYNEFLQNSTSKSLNKLNKYHRNRYLHTFSIRWSAACTYFDDFNCFDAKKMNVPYDECKPEAVWWEAYILH